MIAWTDEEIAQKQTYLIERIKQEEKDATERMEELAASLALLEKIEKRQLITEDQFRAIERPHWKCLSAASAATGKML